MYEELILEWNPWYEKKYFYMGIKRDILYEIKETLDEDFIIFLTGIRRSGKTQILYQIIEELKNKNNTYENLLMIKIDDIRIKNELSLEFINKIIEEHQKIFGKKEKLYLFLDEIQELNNFEQTLKTIYDIHKGEIKIFATGSNARLLKKNISTFLTGRKKEYNITPFSFKEYLRFKEYNITHKIDYLKNKIEIEKLFDIYLKEGGLPETFIIQDKNQYLKELVETITLKDIVVKHDIKNSKKILEMVHYLISNSPSEISFNKTSKIIGISNDSFSEYISYLEEVFLLHKIVKYDFSLKKQIVNPKKFYIEDNGLISSFSFKVFENKSSLFENLVFQELKRRKYEIFYFNQDYECDFIAKNNNYLLPIQVSLQIKEEKTKLREERGLLQAIEKLDLDKGYIITYDKSEIVEKKINGEKIIIEYINIIEWLLEFNENFQ